MRGLDVRIALAMARVAGVIDPGSDKADLWYVITNAYAMGVQEGLSGLDGPPGMFMDEPQLLSAWEEGRLFASELSEMAGCSGCNASPIDPCPFHG